MSIIAVSYDLDFIQPFFFGYHNQMAMFALRLALALFFTQYCYEVIVSSNQAMLGMLQILLVRLKEIERKMLVDIKEGTFLPHYKFYQNDNPCVLNGTRV